MKDKSVTYESSKAAEDMWTAMLLVPEMKFDEIGYINEETAAANLDMAILWRDTHGIPLS